MSDTHKQKNPFIWLLNYFREARAEMRKITWPSRQNITKYSMIVIGLCLILAFLFAGLDFVLSFGLQKFLTLKK